MKKYIRIICCATSFLCIISCSAPEDELNNMISKALRTAENVDEKEWKDLENFILTNKSDLVEFISDDTVNAEKLTNHIKDFSKKRNREEVAISIYNPKAIAKVLEKPKVIFFIENSGSMDGYVRNRTEFEASISDLLVQLQYQYDQKNLSINFINTKIYPSQIKEVNSFVDSLEPGKAPYKVGNRTVSKLNEILKMVLDSANKNRLAILVSDCIYSLGSGTDTEGALEFEKSLTKGAFLQKSKALDFSTIVLKMKSKFTGFYWDKNNQPLYVNNLERPYYIWIIGSNQHVNAFSRDIKTKLLKGFQNSYFLSDFTHQNPPYYAVLKETRKIGEFKSADRTSEELKSIHEIEYQDGILQFSIAIDLSNIPVDSDYLTDIKNYKLPEAYKIQSIDKISRNLLTKRDMHTVEKTTATHLITVATSNKYRLQDLHLELSNKIPAWVNESNSMGDASVLKELNKTFGIYYLVAGIAEAYTIQNPLLHSYFAIDIKIKN